jgi:hypothetical protein
MDGSKLFRASSRPAIFTQEPFELSPFSAFAPGVLQGPGPAALGLVVRGEVASMITLMGWVRFWLRSPNILAMSLAAFFACLVRLSWT